MRFCLLPNFLLLNKGRFEVHYRINLLVSKEYNKTINWLCKWDPFKENLHLNFPIGKVAGRERDTVFYIKPRSMVCI